MDATFIWILVGVIVVIAGFATLSWYLAEQRRKLLRSWAESKGWRFSSDYDYGLDSRHPEFSGLQQGSNRYAYNQVWGTMEGRQVRTFDYHYETYSTDSKGRRQTHHHYFSGVILTAGIPLKPLKIREEGFFDKIGSFFGFDDINFESIEFSKTFHVTAPDRRWAFDVIPQETIEFLLSSPRFTLELDRNCVLAYRNSTLDPKQLEKAINLICGFLDRIPTSVVAELKGSN